MAVRFRRLQVGSAAFMAFAHGSNDAQKTMGIITLALLSAGVIPDFTVPTWVIVVSATALSARDRGRRLADHEDDGPAGRQARAGPRLRRRDDRGDDPVRHGRSFGMPVSTTQVISGAIMGVGSSQGLRHVRWGVARRILVAWILTLPAAGILAALAWLALTAIGLS